MMCRARSVVLLLLVALVAGCHWSTANLTRSGTDTFQYSEDGADGMTVSGAAANTDNENREIFWKGAGPTAVDTQQCETWTAQTDPTDITQQGVALRIVLTGGVPKTVTVTKNIWLGAFWIFNFHEWTGSSANLLGGIDLSQTFRIPNTNEAWPLPWRICARTNGATLEFKAWRAGVETEPAYGDPAHGGSATLDPAFVYAGQAGNYVGHVPASKSARYDACCS